MLFSYPCIRFIVSMLYYCIQSNFWDINLVFLWDEATQNCCSEEVREVKIHQHENQTKQKQSKNKTKQNKTKQNKTKQNKTKQNKTKQNKTNALANAVPNIPKYQSKLFPSTWEVVKMSSSRMAITIRTATREPS